MATILRCLFATVLAVFAGLSLPAAAGAREPRIALVIANGAYANFDRLDATRVDG